MKFDCRIHAYVLMTNHVHLLVTPGAVGMVGRMMQTVGRRYVRYVNDSLGRTGTLWEGRYKSSLVDSESYLLECYRYIELNPVRAAMVAAAQDYRWSSFGHNGQGRIDPLIHPHEVYERIDQDPEKRRAEYRHLVAQGIDEVQLHAIRQYAQRQRALGSNRFQADIEQQLQRRAGLGQPGRPRRSSTAGEKVL